MPITIPIIGIIKWPENKTSKMLPRIMKSIPVFLFLELAIVRFLFMKMLCYSFIAMRGGVNICPF
jgi:hypothetical protein